MDVGCSMPVGLGDRKQSQAHLI